MGLRIKITFLFLLSILIIGCGLGKNTAEESYAPQISPDLFVAEVDHPYMPLTPGQTLVYEGLTEDGFEHVEVMTTEDRKVIMGIICTVVYDIVWMDGNKVEETYDWYAQDKEGNVWYFGEDSKEFKDGQVVSSEGSWEAGVDGALPGLIMQAEPAVGNTYRQEYKPGEAEDMAEIIMLDEKITVNGMPFDNVIKTKEWTPLEPDVSEYKYYAKDIGLILEEAIDDKELAERLELVEIR